MGDYNHITLVGNVASVPVKKVIGKRIKCSFKIAVDRYNGKDNPTDVDFFNIVTWGKLAEICYEYISKDKRVLLDGKLQVTNKDDKWLTEIIADNIKFLTKTS